jgi:hypothetical protein
LLHTGSLHLPVDSEGGLDPLDPTKPKFTEVARPL